MCLLAGSKAPLAVSILVHYNNADTDRDISILTFSSGSVSEGS